MKTTQCQLVLEYMKKYGSITHLVALNDIGCRRLESRINDLRAQGIAIGVRKKTGKKRDGGKTTFTEYYLIEED